MRLNLRGKLLICFCAVAVVPMIGVGLASYFNSLASFEKEVEKRMRSFSRLCRRYNVETPYARAARRRRECGPKEM